MKLTCSRMTAIFVTYIRFRICKLCARNIPCMAEREAVQGYDPPVRVFEVYLEECVFE